MKRLVLYGINHIYETLGIIAVLCSICLVAITHNILLFVIPLMYYIICILIDFVVYSFCKRKPLLIKTPDGYDEPYHPSVLFFEKPWNGYQYWMAYSPLPLKAAKSPYIDRWECPCVYTSTDGVSFADQFQNGFLDDLSSNEIMNGDYFSDPHLVYNEKTDELEIYYRLTHHRNDCQNNEELLLLRKRTKDGKHWHDRERLVNSLNSPIGSIFISQAIIRENGKYRMWYVSSYNENRSLSVVDSADMINYKKVSICNFGGRTVDPWHIDCRKIGNEYLMLIYEFNNELSIWKSDNGIDFRFCKVILKAQKTAGIFYHGLYRACMVDNHKDDWNIYFSFKNQKGNGIGIAQGDTVYDCKIINGNGCSSFKLFVDDIVRKYFFLIKKIVLRLRSN